MDLSHFTNMDNVTPYSVEQTNDRWDKPRGLWVSVDGEDDWPTWCQVEEYDIGANRFAVTLTDSASLLYLTTAQQILEFDDEYGMEVFRVDWTRVSEKYQGIIIAPYQWSLRLAGPNWYYTWDVASGCIWDATAVSAVRKRI